MNKFWFDLLKSTSVENINFLKDVHKAIIFNKQGKWKYLYIPFANIDILWDFIIKMDEKQLLTVIPMISIDGKEDKPHLILSQQFLMTQYSNPDTIMKFINDQLHIAYSDFDFELDLDKKFYLILKYKDIELI